MRNNNDQLSGLAIGVGVVVGVIVCWGVIFGVSSLTARWTPEPGQIGVVREGSSFWWIGDWRNGHGIKKVVPPGAGNTGIGLGSTVHAYPADSGQRIYTITADKSRGDRPGVDFVQVPSEDGINVKLEGTIYFNTAFNGDPKGQTLVRDFDNRFGVRTFPVVGTQGEELHAWDGNRGWESFLDAIVRPIIDNDLREQIALVSCAQLQASCALVANQTAGQKVKPSGAANNVRLAAIQKAINSSLEQDLKSTLGQDYFSNVQFRLSKVTLPDEIQKQITHTQAQYAAVSTAQAQLKQANIEAQTNAAKERGYKACPACAEAAVLAAIPSNVTTFAPGAGFAITPK